MTSNDMEAFNIAKQRVQETVGTIGDYLNNFKEKDHAKAKEKYWKLVQDEHEKVLKEWEKAGKKGRKIIGFKQKQAVTVSDDIDLEKNKNVKSYVTLVRAGYREIIPCKEIDAETIELKIDGKKRLIYTGLKPVITKIPSGIIPSRWRNFLAGRFMYIRNHFLRWGEPFTREPYTGEIIEFEKMAAVLVEREFFFEKVNEKGEKQYIPNPDKIDVNYFHKFDEESKKGFTIYDVSVIDCMVAEFEAMLASKTLVAYWDAAKKIGRKASDWLPWIAIMAVAIVAMVLLSGVLE